VREDAQGRKRARVGKGVLNPLRSEQEAFRFLVYVVVVVAVVVGLVLVVRAVT
jgi:hypothetical protein